MVTVLGSSSIPKLPQKGSKIFKLSVLSRGWRKRGKIHERLMRRGNKTVHGDESSVPWAMESLQPSLAAGVEQCLWETGIDSYTQRWADSRVWGILLLEKFSACFVQDLM